ncbi:hypothetical protein [Novosphingobium sp.]|uniref:hypothetical protein n=1 Tax=Novosphingobium sp. TaxID=1874826 RepID=UPI002631DD23|nr:hypothetical protein [Novosphingobium sp.]
MADSARNVLLPLMLPTQKQLRAAVAAIIRDIQHRHAESDQCTADRVGISVGTIRNARDEKTDLNALSIAKIGAIYGADAVAPYNALYGATAHGVASSDAAPLTEMADALAALMRAGGPKARLDALPTLRAALDAMGAYVVTLERWKIAA